MTYGYITKNTRITCGLEKEHYVDARCISGHPMAKPLGHYFLKAGRKKLNQAPYLVKGYRLFDLVEYAKELYYVYGRRATGYFDIRKLDGTKVNKGSINCKYLRLLATRKSILTEMRPQGAIPPLS